MNDIEFKSQQISNQKIRLADDSEKVATKYSEALNKTRLMVNDPVDKSQSQLTYASIMSPKGQMSGGYNLQTAQGKVVVSSTVASAFEKSNSLSQFLSALSVPQTAANLSEAQNNYNQSVTNLNTAQANLNNFVRSYSNITFNDGSITFPTRQVWVEDSVNTADTSSSVNTNDTSSSVNTNDTSSSVNTNDTSSSVNTNDTSSSVNTNDTSSSVNTNDTSSSVNTNDSAGSASGVSHAAARRSFMMMDDQSFSGGGGGGGGGGVTTVTSPTVNVNDSVGSGGGSVNSTDTTSSVNTNDTSNSVNTNETTNSSSQPTGHYETRDVYSASEKTSITASYQQLLNKLENARNNYDTAVQALNEAQSGANTESSVGNEAYYTNLYNQMCSSGYEAYSQSALNSPDYLQYQLETGGWYLGKRDADGKYNQTSLSTTTMVVSASADKADMAKAEAEYNAETAKINKKEKKLDNELKKLDTEHSALQTEMESVKNLIGNNVEKTFNLFS